MLQSQRLTLRAMRDADASGILAIYGDPRVMRYTGEDPFADLRTVDIMLASVRRLLAEGASLEWAIALRDSDQIIGTCGLHHFDQRQAQVGCLLRHSAWGQGYMTEAIGLLTHYAAGVLHMKRLLADVAPENERAQGFFKKLGYGASPSGMLGMPL